MDKKFVMSEAYASAPVIAEDFCIRRFIEAYKKATEKKVPRALRPSLYHMVTGYTRDLTLYECLEYGQVWEDGTHNGVQLFTKDGTIPKGPKKSQKKAAILLRKGIKPWYITNAEFSEYMEPIAEKAAELEEAKQQKAKREIIMSLEAELKGLSCIFFSTYKANVDIDPKDEVLHMKRCLTIRAKDYLTVFPYSEKDPDDSDRDNQEPNMDDEDNLKLSAYENARRSIDFEDSVSITRSKKDGIEIHLDKDKSDIEVGYERFAGALRNIIRNNPDIFDAEPGLPEDHGFNGENWGEFLDGSYKRKDDPEGLQYALVPVWENGQMTGEYRPLTFFGLIIRTETCRPLLGDRIYAGCLGCSMEELKGYDEWRAYRNQKDAEAEAAKKQQKEMMEIFLSKFGAPDNGVTVEVGAPHPAHRQLNYDELPDEVVDMPF